VEHIRKRSAEDNLKIRAAGEFEVEISSDNMAVPALLAFANASFHPADTFSREYAMMTPIKEYLGGDPESVMENFLKEVEAFGFAEAFAKPARFLSEKAGNAFTQTRIRQFMEMCENFDTENERDCDAFTSFARKYKIREGAASDTIQVMSVHKSKGLDFDIVILPELEKTSSHGGLQIAVLKDGNVVRKPSKALSAFDEKLAEIRSEIEDESAFEALCLYYVALTRAKKSMHFIIKSRKTAPAENSGDFARLFSDVFTVESQEIRLLEGDPKWLASFPVREIARGNDSICPALFFMEPAKELAENSAPEIDLAKTNSQKLLGSCIHSIFEKLTATGCDAHAARENVSYLYPNDSPMLDDAENLVEKALRNVEVRKIFEHADYWAEKPYSLIVNSKLQIGRFDRVNFYPEGNRAEIIDFKTRSDTDNDGHKEQLLRYSDALRKITGIENIALKILSVADGKIIDGF
jgi:ATP-dependent helicase/nuclease subunit A